MAAEPASRRERFARRQRLIIACACAVLCLPGAGCGRSSDTTGKRAETPLAAPTFSDRLGRAGPTWRNAILLRAITDSDRTCDRVTASAYQQAYKGMGMWRVGCHDGGNWAVFIGPKGNAQVGQCSALGTNVPRCETLAAKLDGKQ